MPACSRCLVEVFPGTKLCPRCGAAIRPQVIARPAPKRARKARRTPQRPEREGSPRRTRHLDPPRGFLAALVQHRPFLRRWTQRPRMALYSCAELGCVGALCPGYRVRRRRPRGDGPNVQGSPPRPDDWSQCCSRDVGLPAQAGRIQLVVGRLSRARPPPSLRFCPLALPSSTPIAGAESADPSARSSTLVCVAPGIHQWFRPLPDAPSRRQPSDDEVAQIAGSGSGGQRIGHTVGHVTRRQRATLAGVSS